MGFKEDIAQDIDEVFFDEDFFASRHMFDGEEVLVIEEDAGLEKFARKQDESTRYRDEIHKKPVLIFIRETDVKRYITVGTVIEYDGSMYQAAMLSKQSGVLKILLEGYSV